MKCVVNRKSVLDKCFEIANNTDNVGTFSEENNDIYQEHSQQSGMNFKRDSRIESLIYNRDTEESSYEKELDIKDAINIVSSNSEYNAVISLLKELSQTQKSKYLEGLKIIVDSKHYGKKRAYYDASTQTIHIDGFAQYKNGDCSSVLLHEIMHHLTVERLKYDTETRNNLQNILDEYNKKFPSITYLKEHALEEFVADIWSDETTINNLKNIETKDKSLWNKILDFFKNIISGIFKNSKDTLFQDASVELANLLTADFDEISTLRENKVSNPIFYENQNTINDDTIHSTNADASNAIENRINRTFPVQPSIVKRIDDNTIRIGDTTKVEEVYKVNDSAKQSDTRIISHSVRTAEENLSPNYSQSNVDYINDLKRSFMGESMRLSLALDTFYSNIDLNRLTPKQIKELEGEYNLLSKTKSDIDEVLSTLATNKNEDEKIIQDAEDILVMAERIKNYLFPGIGRGEPKTILNYRGDASISSIMDTVFQYAKAYYSSELYNSVISEKLPDSLSEQINNQKSRFAILEKEYEDYKNIKAKNLIVSNPNTRKYNSLRNIVGDEKAFQEMFSTKGKSDISAFEKIFYAIDNNWSDDTAIKQFLGKIQEGIELEQNTEYFNDRKKLVDLLKRMKEIGVNLERKETFSWFFEKFKNGQETGRFINCFTPEFEVYLDYYSKQRPNFSEGISQRNNARQYQKLQTFHDSFNVINIMVLPEFSEGTMEFEQLDALSGGYLRLHKDDFFKTDMEYQGKLKKLLGLQYDRIINAYRDILNRTFIDFNIAANEYIEEQKQDSGTIIDFDKAMTVVLNKNANRNFYKMIFNLNEIQNGKPIDSYLSSNENNLYYNYNMVPVIPKADKTEFYNQDFREHFSADSEHADLMKDFYDTMVDIYGNKIGVTFYNDVNNTQYAKLAEDWVDTSMELVGRAKFGQLGKHFATTFKGSFFQRQFIESDKQRVMLNYLDEPLKMFGKTMDMLDTASDKALIALIKKYDIQGVYDEANNKFLDDVQIIKHIIAHKITQRDFSENFFKSTANLLELRAKQITRERCYNIAQTLFDYYKTNNPNRTKGIEQFRSHINRAYVGMPKTENPNMNAFLSKENIQKWIDMSNRGKPSFMRKAISKIAKVLLTREEPSKKELNEVLGLLSLNKEGDRDSFTFKFDGNTYLYDGEKNMCFEKIGKSIDYNRIDEDRFFEKLQKYYESFAEESTEYVTMTSIMDGLLNFLPFKFMAGIPFKTGIFNRAEGGIANSEMDVVGEFWEPGDFVNAQKALPWIEISKFLTSDGKIQLLNNKAVAPNKWLEKLLILKYIADRGGIMQDMTNVFDRSLEGSRKTDIKNVFNLYNVSINVPEYRNQIIPVGAMLMSQKVKLLDGSEITVCDKKMNFNFLKVDFEKGEIVLKDEYKNEPGCQEWITFATTRQEKVGLINETVTTDVFEFVYKAKTAIHTIHGDYRELFKKLYSQYRLGAAMMFLKGWWPAKAKRAFNSGKNVRMISNDGTGISKTAPGKYYTAATKGGVLTNLATITTPWLHTSRGAVSALLSYAILPATAVVNLGYTLYQKHKNGYEISQMTKVDSQYLKALLMETALLVPRLLQNTVLLRYTGFNPTKFIHDHIFKDKALLKELGEGDISVGERHAGNIHALARETAFMLYTFAIGYLAYALLWDPDDDDDDNRRQFLYFIANNLGRISNTLSSFVSFAQNVQENYSVDELPIWDIIQSVQKIHKYRTENNIKMRNKYLMKILPIPRVLPQDFLPYAQYDFYKEAMYNKDMKDYITGGEQGAESYYSQIYRAALKEAILEAYEDEKLSDEFREQLDRKLLSPEEIAAGKTCYDLKQKGLTSHYKSKIKDAIGKIVPNKKKLKAGTYQEAIEKLYKYYKQNEDWIGDVPQMELRTPERLVSKISGKYQEFDEEDYDEFESDY